MASPWLWGVIAIATWWSWWWSAPWEGPVQSSCYRASCSSTGYAGRTKGGKEMALCIAGIVGTWLTLRGAHTWCCLGPIVCSRLCALCVDASRGGMGIPWVSFTLLVSPLRHLVQHPHKLVNAVKWIQEICCTALSGLGKYRAVRHTTQG